MVHKPNLFRFLFLMTVAISMAASIDVAHAASRLKLVDDAQFIKVNQFKVSEIQAILKRYGSFLKNFKENGRTAAQIIYDAAQGHGDASGTVQGIGVRKTVNPAVILATLQKEQSLITMSDKNNDALRAATGYACPDGGGCNPNYAGFTAQVENAAFQLRFNYERADNLGFPDFQVDEPIEIDGEMIKPSNRATASLLRYTPHLGGNRNFAALFKKYNSRSAAAREEAKQAAIAKAQAKAAAKALKIQRAKEVAAAKAAAKKAAAQVAAQRKVEAKTRAWQVLDEKAKAVQAALDAHRVTVSKARETLKLAEGKADIKAASKQLKIELTKEKALLKAATKAQAVATKARKSLEAAQKVLTAATAKANAAKELAEYKSYAYQQAKIEHETALAKLANFS